MRKLYSIAIAVGMTISAYLTGCAANDPDPADSIKADISQANPSLTAGEHPAPESAHSEDRTVDFDLTGLNTNMLYAEVFHMGAYPEKYNGKTIKLTGTFARFPKSVDEKGLSASNDTVYVCMISDAMACCSIGIEFTPEKGSSFWTNPPEVGSKITITGLCDISIDENAYFTVIRLNNTAIEQIT